MMVGKNGLCKDYQEEDKTHKTLHSKSFVSCQWKKDTVSNNLVIIAKNSVGIRKLLELSERCK